MRWTILAVLAGVALLAIFGSEPAPGPVNQTVAATPS